MPAVVDRPAKRRCFVFNFLDKPKAFACGVLFPVRIKCVQVLFAYNSMGSDIIQKLQRHGNRLMRQGSKVCLAAVHDVFPGVTNVINGQRFTPRVSGARDRRWETVVRDIRRLKQHGLIKRWQNRFTSACKICVPEF